MKSLQCLFLQDKLAVILKGHKKTDATASLSVIEKTHALLRSALNQAVIWEYITSTAMVLALGCSMCIGEILGLTWDCVDYLDEKVSQRVRRTF